MTYELFISILTYTSYASVKKSHPLALGRPVLRFAAGLPRKKKATKRKEVRNHGTDDCPCSYGHGY